MADGLFGGAAFGFYPQLNRYRRGDPRDALNLPVDVTRGRFAGTMGTPTDIANLVRSPSPMEMFGDVSYEPPAQLPYTTEHFLKELPMAPTSRLGQVAGQAASFAPINPMPAVRGLQKVGGIVGEELAATLMGQRPGSMMSRVVPQPLFAVEPSLAQALGEAPTRQELLAKMQGLLGQKMGLSAGPELNAVNQEISALQQQFKQMPSVQRVAKEVVAPEITASVSDIGFYSAAEQAGQGLARQSGTGESFLNDLMKAPDVKKDELSWMGLDDYLKGKPNVTKQEVQDFIAANKVDVKEVKLGGNEAPSQDLLSWMSARSIMPPRNPEGWQELSQKLESYAQQHQKAQGAPEASQRYFTLSEEAGRISEGLDAGGSAAGATKYQKYQLPGGENYREILLTLPNQWDKPRAAQIANETRIQALRQEMHGTSGTDEIRSEISRLRNENTALQQQISDAPIYKSSHFNEPNILAHMRVNDRIDADGKKMLLIEEVQSDWHQAGREKGYKTKEGLEKWYNQNKLDDDPSFADLNSEQRSVIERNRSAGMGGDNAVPDAPFKDTWHQLALKRALKYAADNGYERIGLTTGKRQIERFADELRQNVDEIAFSSGYPSKDITTISASQNGRPTFTGTVQDGKFIDGQAQGKTVEEVLGKSMAKQIAEKESGVLKGDDLTIGGEGMKKYYDEIYPKFLDKYGKKYGASVGETKIKTDNVPYVDYVVKQGYFNDHTVFGIEPNGTATIINQNAQNMAEAQALANRYKEKNLGGGETIRYLDVTPQMKQGTSKGQPLFAAVPALPLATVDYSDPFQDSIR